MVVGGSVVVVDFILFLKGTYGSNSAWRLSLSPASSSTSRLPRSGSPLILIARSVTTGGRINLCVVIYICDTNTNKTKQTKSQLKRYLRSIGHSSGQIYILYFLLWSIIHPELDLVGANLVVLPHPPPVLARDDLEEVVPGRQWVG